MRFADHDRGRPTRERDIRTVSKPHRLRLDRHIGAMPQAGICAHSGTVQRLVGPGDLARFDSTVKVPTEGSGRTSRHPGRRVPARSLCDGPGVHSAGSARAHFRPMAVIIAALATDEVVESAAVPLTKRWC